MSLHVDLNADLGEGAGHDAELFELITSANIACGFHAGDPHIMRECVRLAKLHGVGVGAHVGFLDLMGFGRRRIDLTPAQLRDHVIYQVGALMGFALVPVLVLFLAPWRCKAPLQVQQEHR